LATGPRATGRNVAERTLSYDGVPDFTIRALRVWAAPSGVRTLRKTAISFPNHHWSSQQEQSAEKYRRLARCIAPWRGKDGGSPGSVISRTISTRFRYPVGRQRSEKPARMRKNATTTGSYAAGQSHLFGAQREPIWLSRTNYKSIRLHAFDGGSNHGQRSPFKTGRRSPFQVGIVALAQPPCRVARRRDRRPCDGPS
jgi:hypothetical protein